MGFHDSRIELSDDKLYSSSLDKGAGSPVGWHAGLSIKNYRHILLYDRLLERLCSQERATLIIHRYVSSSFAQSISITTCPLTQRTKQLGIWHTHTTLLYCAYAVKYKYLPTYQVEFTEHNAKVYTLVIPSLYAARMQSCLKVDV